MLIVCMLSLTLSLSRSSTKAGKGKTIKVAMPTFNTTVGLNGVLKEGQDQHSVGYIKNGAYTGNSVSSTMCHLPGLQQE